MKILLTVVTITRMADDLIMVYVTCPEDNAEEIAETLVANKFVACVNILPVRSIYIWEGKLNRDTEALLLIKTKKRMFKALESKIAEIHPYDVPEIVAIRADSVSESYLQWVISQTSSSG